MPNSQHHNTLEQTTDELKKSASALHAEIKTKTEIDIEQLFTPVERSVAEALLQLDNLQGEMNACDKESDKHLQALCKNVESVTKRTIEGMQEAASMSSVSE